MITIEKNGVISTVQGGRRAGYLAMGFPGSGPVDSVSMRAANYLVGQHSWQSTIEMHLKGPHIRFHQAMEIAICGANMRPLLNGEPIVQHQKISVASNDLLTFQPATDGVVTYLAFNGKMAITAYLGSTSTYQSANLGGLTLQKGDELSFGPLQSSEMKVLPNRLRFVGQDHVSLRVTAGPEFALFSEEIKAVFFNSTFRVSADSNRMGIRLTGDQKITPDTGEINSSAIIPGTIQVPQSGQPIVLSHDHQTTGGYPRIANVITHDLDYLTQCRPGSTVTFRLTHLKKAQELLEKREQYLKGLFRERRK